MKIKLEDLTKDQFDKAVNRLEATENAVEEGLIRSTLWVHIDSLQKLRRGQPAAGFYLDAAEMVEWF